MCALGGKAEAKLLELGCRHFVTDVQRLRDERRLGKLLGLDAGKRAIGDKAAAGGCSGNELRIDALATERGFDQRLTLLDLAGTGFGCC